MICTESKHGTEWYRQQEGRGNRRAQKPFFRLPAWRQLVPVVLATTPFVSPPFPYTIMDGELVSNGTADVANTAEHCAICIHDIAAGSLVSLVPCNHSFW